MIAILRTLAVNAMAFFAGRQLARTAAVGVAGGAVGAGALALGQGLTGGGFRRRRRRTRALNCSDKADLAFIRATLGPTAAREALGVILARC